MTNSALSSSQSIETVKNISFVDVRPYSPYSPYLNLLLLPPHVPGLNYDVDLTTAMKPDNIETKFSKKFENSPINFESLNYKYIPLFGHLLLSLSAPTLIDKISLKLEGVYNVDFIQSFQTTDGFKIVSLPVTNNEVIGEIIWDDILRDGAGCGKFGSLEYKSKTTEEHLNFAHELGTLKNYPFSSSETPFTQSSKSQCILLPQGNYKIPFSCELPPWISESVEGIGSANIIWNFKASIIGKYNLLSQINKGMRILRLADFDDLPSHINGSGGPHEGDTSLVANPYTFTYQSNYPLRSISSEEYVAENIWPGKVQYKLRLPRRNLPLGETLKLHLLILPLTKSVKLGKISLSILQNFKIKTKEKNKFDQQNFSNEKIVVSHELPIIPETQLSRDGWALMIKFCMPVDVKHCSPDVNTVDGRIIIKHKLLLCINLINADGHISQVKSKLPLCVYLSPEICFKKGVVSRSLAKNKDIWELSRHKEKMFRYAGGEPHGSMVPPVNSLKKEAEVFVRPFDETNPESFLWDDDFEGAIDAIGNSKRNEIPPTYEEAQHDELISLDSGNIESKFITNEPTLDFVDSIQNMHGHSITPAHGSSASLVEMMKEGAQVDQVPLYRDVWDDEFIGNEAPIYTEYAHEENWIDTSCNGTRTRSNTGTYTMPISLENSPRTNTPPAFKNENSVLATPNFVKPKATSVLGNDGNGVFDWPLSKGGRMSPLFASNKLLSISVPVSRARSPHTPNGNNQLNDGFIRRIRSQTLLAGMLRGNSSKGADTLSNQQI
ncbi:hypothetical protein DAMA08_049080 [Martiniozyma asiatica (nom. inval.)]|nr:hypothetical protein DAMA08_049080 [Martiniozyma asiatica]